MAAACIISASTAPTLRPPPVSVDFIKSWVVASVSGFFVCMWCAAKKHCHNVLGISSRIQRIEMLFLVSLKTPILLLWFPTADAALPSSMSSVGDTVIPGVCVALALCIAAPRGSKNPFFSCAFLRYTVSLTVTIIIMNWFQAAQLALQYVASSVIGFVAIHCLWNGKVKQLMGKVWDWNIYETKLKKFHGWVLHTANEDGGDRGDGPEDGSSTGGDGPEDGSSTRGDGPDDGSSTGSDEGQGRAKVFGPRAVQLLAIRANFPVMSINAYDWHNARVIYSALEAEVQEEGMVDLVPIGPSKILEAYGSLALKVFTADDTDPVIIAEWDSTWDDEVDEYTYTIDGDFGRKFEIIYLEMPEAVDTHVNVRLNLKDLGSGSRAVYGSIKASAIDYGGKSVYLFSRGRGRSLSFPCGSTCILPLSPRVIAVPAVPHC